MVVSCQQMQEAEARLFSSGVPAEPLMDKAGAGCALAIRNTFSSPGKATLFCGKGNNGGDALVIGAWLRKWAWDVEVRFSHPIEETTSLTRKKYREFQAIPNKRTLYAPGAYRVRSPEILIDGLLGIGATGPLRGPIGELAKEMNHIRSERGAICFAVDIPSGVDGDTGEVYHGAVIADHTLSICIPKRGIISDQAINHVGRIHSIPLPEISVSDGDQSISVLSPENLRPKMIRRDFDTHKGKAGRITIIAGSKGLTGAAVLSSLGALHSGGGLITTFVPEEIYSIVAAQAPIEVMVRPYRQSIDEILNHPSDVFAIGPGLGNEIHDEILNLAVFDSRPAVLDADVLNWISKNPELIQKLPRGKRVLTPHPGELARLTDAPAPGRIETARALSEKWGVTLVNKGARSVISSPGETTDINSTGTPKMASGGMGDVLTGMTASFIAQGMSLHNAACTASWSLGRAAELTTGSVPASRVAKSIGKAIAELR